MNLRKMLLVTAVLMGTAAMMFLPGCANPVASNGCSSCAAALPDPGDLQILGHNIKDFNNGFYYQVWDNDKGSPTLNYANGTYGNYSLTWSGNTKDWNFVCGKGWNPAKSNRVVSYTGTFNPAAAATGSDKCNSMLDFYGWANNCGIEYYVLEGYGEFSPDSEGSGYTKLGEYDSHGTHYHAYYKRQTGPTACGSGNASFDQLYSVRVPRVGFGSIYGTIWLQDHVDKWKQYGYTINSQMWQIMATEGFVGEYPAGTIRPSSGNSNITIIEGTTSTAIGGEPGTTANTPSGYPESRVALKARYGSQYYFTVQSDGLLYSNGTSRGSAQTFYMVDLGGGKVALRSKATGNYVCAENGGSSQAVANRPWIDRWETFDFGTFPGINNSVTLKNNAWSSDGAQAGWYLRFDGNSQQYRGTGCIFYLENF